MSQSRKWHDRLLRGVMYLSAGLTVLLLAGLIGFILWKGIRYLSWQMLSTSMVPAASEMTSLPSWASTVPG